MGTKKSQTSTSVHGPKPMRRHAISFKDATDLTRQSFKEQCDVNNIVRTFATTGVITHLARIAPEFGDAPTMDLHQAACIQAEIASKEAEGAFDKPDTESRDDSPEEATEASGEATEAETSTDDKEVDKQSIPL